MSIQVYHKLPETTFVAGKYYKDAVDGHLSRANLTVTCDENTETVH